MAGSANPFDELDRMSGKTATRRRRIDERRDRATPAKKVVVTYTLDADVRQAITKAAANETSARGVHVSASALVNRVLREWVDDHDDTALASDR